MWDNCLSTSFCIVNSHQLEAGRNSNWTIITYENSKITYRVLYMLWRSIYNQNLSYTYWAWLHVKSGRNGILSYITKTQTNVEKGYILL